MLRKRHIFLCTSAIVVALLIGIVATITAQDSSLSPLEELGKALYFDTNLSIERNQSCATCHSPETGFTGSDSEINLHTAVYPGSIHTLFGNRKPPTAAYAGDSPNLYYDEAEEVWVGGMFWDGRATGEILGDPLAEQAQGPYLNPLEQALLDAQHLCLRVEEGDYTALFDEVWGEGVLECVDNADEVYIAIGRSVAAFERSSEVNPFTSKYDYYLAGEAELTELEAFGLELFNEKALCSACHPSELGPNGESPLFTDFTFDNLGTPINPNNPFYMNLAANPEGEAWRDPGLGGFLKAAGYPPEVYEAEWGKHKVPTLRNVDQRPFDDFVKFYGHNGSFTSLDDIVHFYNTRDIQEWPEPEVAENVNTEELGNIGLTPEEETAVVAFLKTLSDGYQP
jgi:cytochrome c peroxidase